VLLIAVKTPALRPPAAVQAALEGQEVESIFVHDQKHYDTRRSLRPRRTVPSWTPPASVVDDQGNSYRYQKALLATGGTPRRLTIPAGIAGVCYFATWTTS